MNSKLKHVVIFEGPDICGKTTSIEYFKDFLKKEKMYNVYTPRFPNYSAYRGEAIHEHLTNFNFYNQFEKERPLSILNALDENSINLMQNKIDVVSGNLIEEIAKRDCDVVLIDRFVISQYIYDYCWIEMFKEAFKLENCYTKEYIEKFMQRIDEFDKDIYYRAAIVWSYFVHKIYSTFGTNVKISTIVFKKSNYITESFNRAVSKGERKYDSYDKMQSYQKFISEQFEKLIEGTDEKLTMFIGKEIENLYTVNFDDIKEKVLKENTNFDKLTELAYYVSEKMNYVLADIIGIEVIDCEGTCANTCEE